MAPNSEFKANDSLAALFYRGEYGRVLSATVDRLDYAGERSAVDEIEFVVGALSFSGRVDEAELMFERHEGALNLSQQIACRFYLGVTWCRKLSFENARKRFAQNARMWRAAKDEEQLKFYILQGLAFYRYTYGYLKQALYYSDAAYRAAFTANFAYGRVLAQELKGHAQVATGSIRQGLATLRTAAEWAQSLGRGVVAQSIESGVEYYQAVFGISKDPVEHLEKMLARLSLDDTYARTFLHLEVARQLQMRGQLRAAKAVLDDACQRAYQFSNVRLEALLNFRLAYQQAASGDLSQALNLLKNTQQRLAPDVDKLLEVRVLGLQAALTKQLGLEALSEDQRLRRLTTRTGQHVALRILGRTAPNSTGSYRSIPGQDPLGDLVDRVHNLGIAAAAEVLESGYLSFLHDCAQLDKRSQYIVFGLEGQSMTVFDRGEVIHHPEGISNLQRKLVAALAEGECTKEALCGTLWGQSYNPLRHDQLIYTLVSKLRRTLGERSRWIEVSEAGYRIDDRVRIKNFERTRLDSLTDLGESHESQSESGRSLKKVPDQISEDMEKLQSMLNFRQLEVMKSFDRGDLLDVSRYRELFSVSLVTASRDLAQMEKFGLCRRVGKGRATKYAIQSH